MATIFRGPIYVDIDDFSDDNVDDILQPSLALKSVVVVNNPFVIQLTNDIDELIDDDFDFITVNLLQNTLSTATTYIVVAQLDQEVVNDDDDEADVSFDNNVNLLLTLLAVSGGTTWTITPSGGITFSGTNLFTHEKVYAPSGIITFSGNNSFVKEHVYTVSGGVTFSGAVTVEHNKTYDPSGGVTFSGSNLFAHEKSYAPTGTITFSGTVPLIKNNVVEPSGTITFSGHSQVIFVPFGSATVTTYLPLTGVGQ